MNFEVITKKWGNSIGVIIPSETVEKMSIKPEQKMVLEIKHKENVLKEMFGAGKKIKKPTEQILREIRKDLESKWWK